MNNTHTDSEEYETELVDPISNELMINASIIVPCAHVLNENTILKLINDNKSCPMCRGKIERYIPCFPIRQMIERKYPEIVQKFNENKQRESQIPTQIPTQTQIPIRNIENTNNQMTFDNNNSNFSDRYYDDVNIIMNNITNKQRNIIKILENNELYYHDMTLGLCGFCIFALIINALIK